MSGSGAGPSSTGVQNDSGKLLLYGIPLDDLDNLNIDFDSILGKPKEVREWNDDKLKNKSGIKLVVLETDAAISKMTIDSISCLHSNVTEKAVAQLLVLAWNIRSPKNKERRVFPREDPTSTAADCEVENVSDEIFFKRDNVAMVNFGNDKHIALAGTYIAVSLLRLFSKPFNNYIKAWDRIVAGFRQFYGMPFPFPYLNPVPDCISAIETILRNDPIFINTLTGFLYTFESLGTDKAICSMLYEKHLAFTGLHSYDLFMRARNGLKIESKFLLDNLKSSFAKDALETIDWIINNLDEIDDQTAVAQNKERKTWKYARIFDVSMFSKLQTKSCRELTCVLANLCMLVGEQGSGNILSITELSGLPEERKVYFTMFAQILYDLAIKHRSNKGEENNRLVVS